MKMPVRRFLKCISALNTLSLLAIFRISLFYISTFVIIYLYFVSVVCVSVWCWFGEYFIYTKWFHCWYVGRCLTHRRNCWIFEILIKFYRRKKHTVFPFQFSFCSTSLSPSLCLSNFYSSSASFCRNCNVRVHTIEHVLHQYIVYIFRQYLIALNIQSETLVDKALEFI